mmetsp:Transcript_32891/g.57483  ORF Transcript_32891/g.57483 Transcript_32891/m.57483 type:complete len:372 (-) Transcript_32891:1373-2488(-)
MGSTTCSRLCSSNEYELRQSIIENYKVSEEVFKAGPRLKSLRSPMLHELEKSSRCIQSFWRTRKFKLIIKNTSKLMQREGLHLTRDDATETLGARKLAKAREKKTHAYKNGGVYDGQWLGGFRDGWGIMVWADGSIYRGFWSFGYPKGEGKFTYSDHDVYDGQWIYWNTAGNALQYCLEDSRDGYEWLWLKETSPRQSKLRLDLQTLTSELTRLQLQISQIKRFLSQNTPMIYHHFTENELGSYQGDLVEGLRQGFGKFLWKSGDCYIGQWLVDKQHGWGQNSWADGSSFVGCYKGDLKHGVGEYEWEDGARYLGCWNENKMHGLGQHTWPDGREYIGEWKEGLMHGYGCFSNGAGKKYEGEWRQGKKRYC